MKLNKFYSISIIRVRYDYSTKKEYVFETDDYLDATAEYEVFIKNETRFLSSTNDPKENKNYMYSVVTFFSKMKGVVNQITISKGDK
jgi:hypothetical protein